MEALSQGLQKIYSVARKKKGVAPSIPLTTCPLHLSPHQLPYPLTTHTLHPSMQAPSPRPPLHTSPLTTPTPPHKPLTTPTPPHKPLPAHPPRPPLTTTCPVPVASVHLPRIGYATPSFNWYGTERLIRKNLAAKGISTFMYPFVCEYIGLRQCTQSFKSKHSTINSACLITLMMPDLHTTHRYYFPRRTLLPNQPQTTASASNTEYRSNDSAMTSSSVQGISQLPDVFPEVLALLWGCGQEGRTLTRYIVAYGGDICSCMEEGPTHIVCGNDRDLPQVCACSGTPTLQEAMHDVLPLPLHSVEPTRLLCGVSILGH